MFVEELVKERWKPPIQKGQSLADKIVLSLFILLYAGTVAVTSLDVFRWHLLPKPGVAVSSLGLVLYLASWFLITRVLRENAFASAAVRYQQERRQGDGSWKWDSVIINSDQPLPGTTANGADEQALNQIVQDVSAAMARAEKALGKLKALYKLESVSIKDVKPQIYGDFALVKLTGEMKGKYSGKDQSSTLQGVDFFVRRDGKWQVAYSQNTATVP